METPKGDMWREFFRKYEGERPFSSFFEVSNLGKKSVVMDCKNPAHVAKFKEILAGADVFVTNVRNEVSLTFNVYLYLFVRI